MLSSRLNSARYVLPHLQTVFPYHSHLSKIRHFSTEPISSKSNLSVLKPLDVNPSAVLETLSCYSNDWKKALEFFIWAEAQPGFQHTAETYNRIIDILGKFFEFETAWNLIGRMGKPDRTTFRVMFKRYVSAHLVKEAIDAFKRMEEFNLKDEDSFSNLIDALCEYKHVIEAEELCFGKNKDFGEVRYYQLDTKIYNMILRGWFKIGWWKKCREFWEEMDRRGVEKDLISYTIYMDILCKSGKPWNTVKLYKEMKRKGIKLDMVAYNTVIRAIGISEGVDVSIKLYREIVELGYRPNIVTFNTIIKLLCENGRHKEAYNMLNVMFEKGCEPDVKTYHCFFRCLQKPQEMLGLFDRMFAGGVKPTMDTYVLLMRKFGRWGFLRPVLIVWNKMEELGVSPDEHAYNALIDVLVEKGMVDMARKYDDEMVEKGLSAKPRVELGTKVITSVSDRELDEKTNGYILMNANGGLNQMRFGVCDMVAIAKVIKATLVLPSLDHTSYWADECGFKDLFDWEHFIETLKDDIHTVDALPAEYSDIEAFNKTPISPGLRQTITKQKYSRF